MAEQLWQSLAVKFRLPDLFNSVAMLTNCLPALAHCSTIMIIYFQALKNCFQLASKNCSQTLKNSCLPAINCLPALENCYPALKKCFPVIRSCTAPPTICFLSLINCSTSPADWLLHFLKDAFLLWPAALGNCLQCGLIRDYFYLLLLNLPVRNYYSLPVRHCYGFPIQCCHLFLPGRFYTVLSASTNL